MLDTTLISLQDILLEKILDDAGRAVLCSELPKLLQQGCAHLPGGFCVLSLGRAVSYKQAAPWKVLNKEETHHCLAFMFIRWFFV
ncbi:Homeobox-leucine zipper protein HOX32 [Platanthera guangdongensis]|uniref:Homeobox-leucine zipper protein HOX32 n=1 Tax=Platanthera guangdongensis TaxID=2320717 RepID=A0ABR2MJV3_9ASPA